MIQRDPVRNLSTALQCALEHDLLGIEYRRRDDATGRQRDVGRRPCHDECDVVLFGQVWSGEALGLTGEDGRLNVERDTVVVVGPLQDACVYVGAQLLYHVRWPNRRFYLDLIAHSMATTGDAYEVPDDPVTEAVDIELGAMLARLHAQVKWREPQHAPLVAGFLRRCAAQLEGELHGCPRKACGSARVIERRS